MEPERPAWVTSLAVLERGSELSMASTAISAFDIRNVEKRIVSLLGGREYFGMAQFTAVPVEMILARSE